jgi:type II secretory pathway predicted ATPase ExeA
MYQEFFGFREPPFRITPDPRVLYRNRCYDEAIAALAYGIEQRKGFMSLVGEVGTGKTTLLRHLLETMACWHRRAGIERHRPRRAAPADQPLAGVRRENGPNDA